MLFNYVQTDSLPLTPTPSASEMGILYTRYIFLSSGSLAFLGLRHFGFAWRGRGTFLGFEEAFWTPRALDKSADGISLSIGFEPY
jgi:hypothetical protein